jgi:hypothetical protein
MSLPLFPEGIGAVALALSGALPLPPSWAFGALELTALCLALVWYWRSYQTHPLAGVALSLLPLVFAWRSPGRYFALLPALALIAWTLTMRIRARSATTS